MSVTLKSDFLFDVDSSVVHPGAYSEIDHLARVLPSILIQGSVLKDILTAQALKSIIYICLKGGPRL